MSKHTPKLWAWLNIWNEIVFTGTRAECESWYETQSNITHVDAPVRYHCGQEMNPTVRLRAINAELLAEYVPPEFARQLEDEAHRLQAINAELLRLCIKALNRSARVHPGFADELRAAIEKATS